MSQRFEGRNLEEALQSAAQALGIERWQLAYHVLLEKRGFLGGTKRVVIEAFLNENAPPPAVSAPAAAAADPAPLLDDAPRRPDAPSGRGPRGRSRDRGGSGSGGREGRGRGRDRGRSDLRSGDFESFLGDLPAQGAESDAAKAAREWCETALRLARLDVVARSEENETQIVIRLYGNDGERMIDRHGELLDALQVLANKALVGRSVEKDIELDCAEFKEQRMADLERRAYAVADRVRRGGAEELLPSMTPIERRIVHLALQHDPDVTTESRGEGFYKRVAIVIRSEATAPGGDVPSEPASDQ